MHFKVVVSSGDCVQSWGVGWGGVTFHMLNQPWNVRLIIPRNSSGLFVLQQRFTSPNSPHINHYLITARDWQGAWPTSRPVLWHVHASVCGCAFVLLGWVTPTAHSPLMSSRNTTFVAPFLYFLARFFFVRWDFGGSQTGSLACTFAPWEEKRMIDVIFQETSSKKNTWSERVTVFPATPCYLFIYLKKKSWTGF